MQAPLATVIVAANVALAAIGATTFALWLRGGARAPRRALASVAIGAIGGAALATQVGSDGLFAWFTPLQEGMTTDGLRQIGGHAAHAGPGFEAIVDAVGAGRVVPLEGLLRLNLALWVLGAGAFLAIAWQVLERSWIALAFGVFALVNPASLAGAVSELPGPLLTTYFVLGVLGATTARTSGPTRALGLTTLALAGVLAAAVRIETAVVGAPALVIALLDSPGRDAPGRETPSSGALRRAEDRLALAARRIFDAIADPRRSPRLALLVLGLVLASLVPIHAPYPRALFRALDPFDVAALTFPVTISLVAPIGVVVLALAGTLHAIRQWRSFLGLGLTLLALYKAYYASSHEARAFYELFRYQTNLIPLVLFVSLFGWRELTRLELSEKQKSALFAVLCASMLAYSPARLALTAGRNVESRAPSETAGWLAMDVQREARFLIAARREHPSCRIVAPRVVRAEHGFVQRGYQLVDGAHVELREGDDLAALVWAERAHGCLVYHHGLDCNIEGLDLCAGDVEGRTATRTMRFPREPYGEPEEYGPYRAEIVLALYPLDEAPAAPAGPEREE